MSWKEGEPYQRLTETLKKRIGQEEPDIEKMIMMLSRLNSATPGLSSDSQPQRKLELTVEFLDQSILAISDKYGLNPLTVRKSIRDTWAVLTYLTGGEIESLHPQIKRRIELLGDLNQELGQFNKFLRAPEIVSALKKIPQAGDILRTYGKYRSLDPLFSPLGLQSTQFQERVIRRFYRGQTAAESMEGLNNIVLRYTLEEGLERDTHGIISSAAAYVLEADLSHLPTTHNSRLRTMRIFLTEMAQQEYAKVKPDLEMGMDLNFWFPQKGGQLDVVGMYHQFAASGQCPESLLEHSRMTISGMDKTTKINTFFPRQYYSQEWLEYIDWAGTKFMENILIWEARRPRGELDLSIFTFDVSEILKQAKADYLERINKPKT